MGFLEPLKIDEKQTAIWLNLECDLKQGAIFYWNNNFDYAKRGYFEVVDTSYKDKNLYLCVKKK